MVIKNPFLPRFRLLIQQHHHNVEPTPSVQIFDLLRLPFELREVVCRFVVSQNTHNYLNLMLTCKKFHEQTLKLLLSAGTYFDAPFHFVEWVASYSDLAQIVTDINIPLPNIPGGITHGQLSIPWHNLLNWYQHKGVSMFHGMAGMPNVSRVTIRSLVDAECSPRAFDPPRLYPDLLLKWVTAKMPNLCAFHFQQQISSLKPFRALTQVRALTINVWSMSTTEEAVEVLRSLSQLTELHLFSKDDLQQTGLGVDEFGMMRLDHMQSVTADVVKRIRPLSILSLTDRARKLALLSVEMAHAILSTHRFTLQELNCYGWDERCYIQYEVQFVSPIDDTIVPILNLKNTTDPWARNVPPPVKLEKNQWRCRIWRRPQWMW